MAAPLARGAVHGVGLGASHSHKRPVSISSVRGSSGCAVWSGATATAAATRGVAQRRRPGGVPLLRASAAATTAAASSTATMEHAPSEAARAALFGTAKEQVSGAASRCRRTRRAILRRPAACARQKPYTNTHAHTNTLPTHKPKTPDRRGRGQGHRRAAAVARRLLGRQRRRRLHRHDAHV